MPGASHSRAPLRALLPLTVLLVTLAAILVIKVRAERRAARERRLVQAASVQAANERDPTRGPAPSREPSIGRSSEVPLGTGAVRGQGVTTLHEDGARTHRARGHVPRSPHEKWHLTLGGPIVSQPVLSQDQRTVYVTSLDGKLSAIARENEHQGVLRWAFDLGDRAYGAPLVAADGTLFVGSDAKRFFSISSQGALVWKLDVMGEADSAALLLDSGRIAFAAGSELHIVTPRGEEKARFRARKKIFTAPAGVGGTIYFGSQDHRAYAVSEAGVLKWLADLGADVDGGPVVTDDGTVVFGTDGGRIVALDPASGATKWSTDAGGYVRGALSVGRDGTVLGGVYGPTPGLMRLDPQNGRILGVFAFPERGRATSGCREDLSKTTTGRSFLAEKTIESTPWSATAGFDSPWNVRPT